MNNIIDDSSFRELVDTLRKLSSVVMLDGLATRQWNKITLANSIAVGIAAVSIGPEVSLKLMEALKPIGEIAAAEIAKGNPVVEGFTAASASDFSYNEDGSISKDFIENLLAKKVNINDLLKGTGVFPSEDSPSK